MFGAMSIGDVMMRRASARKADEGEEEPEEKPKDKAKQVPVVDEEDESSSVDEARVMQEISVSTSSSEDKEEPPKQEAPPTKQEEKHEPVPASPAPAPQEKEEEVKPPPAKRAPIARQRSAPRKMVTREQSDVCFMLFRQHDTDNSGGLSPAEVKLLLQDYQLGVRLSDEEAELAVKLLSRSGATEISYRDFASWWHSDDRFKLLQWTPEELQAMVLARDMFARFDKDGNGLVSRSEFRILHRQLQAEGFEVPESLDECLAMVDINGSGQVDFYEFVIFCRKLDLFRKRERLVEAKQEQARSDAALAPEQYVAAVLERTNYAVLKAFTKYDTDKSSSISAGEFRRLVRDLGFNLSEEEAELQVKLMATRGGKEVSFGEFKHWWMTESRVASLRWDADELAKYRYFRDLFDEHDRDQSGLIDESEFGQLHAKMAALGFVLPPEKECLSHISKSNRVSFNDFVSYLKSTGAFQFWKVH
jgi:Ca2+-binding EF-hand superfamily protein